MVVTDLDTLTGVFGSMLNPMLGLLLIPLLAVLAPLLTRALSRWVRVPIAVFELALGILIGPALLGLVAAN